MPGDARTTALAAEASRLPVLQAGDVQALRDHLGRRVIVEGRVASAQWSDSGKVMNIEFAGAEGTGLLAVVFSDQRRQFDEAFAGDFAKTITGREVRVNGDLETYGGYDEAFKNRPQIILQIPEQLTIETELFE